MLFDLRGKRRRAVQGTYLTLAILLGAGLVFFGIGSSVSGGLGDLFSGGGGGSNQGDKIVQDKIEKAEKQLQANPRNEAALGAVIRGHYQLATVNADAQTSTLDKDELLKATAAWKRYLATDPPKPNTDLARFAVQAYQALADTTQDQETARTYWAGASEALELIAGAQPTVNNYLRLVQAATNADQKSKADLAGQRAVSLAPKARRKEVQQQVNEAKAAGQSQAGGGAVPAPSGTAP
jgi:hypothetical protein